MTATKEQTHKRERAWLGYAGLVPVLACVATLAAADLDATRLLAADTLRFYLAVVASFLGAVHWGAAIHQDDERHRARLRWGVMPALLAWTLLLVPPAYAFLGFAVLFGLILYVDCRLLPLLDHAYRALRVRLSIVVILALLLAAPLHPAVGG